MIPYRIITRGRERQDEAEEREIREILKKSEENVRNFLREQEKKSKETPEPSSRRDRPLRRSCP